MSRVRPAILLLAAIGTTAAARADVTFYLSTGSDPGGDLDFQAALAAAPVEFDFERYQDGDEVDALAAGALTIDVNLIEPGTESEHATIFEASAFAFPGVVHENALLNGVTGGPIVKSYQLEFLFSEPVAGFGTWTFDDHSCCNHQFVMIVTESDASEHVSAPLDAGAGGWEVDGFIGAVSTTGITRVVIELQHPDGSPALDRFFELDHVQVAPLEAACPADVSGDGTVDIEDLITVILAWGSDDPAADVNTDGTVDDADLALVVDAWGPCP